MNSIKVGENIIMELERLNPEQRVGTPTVLVVGAGAVGGFYGAKLANAGASVHVVCRSDYDVVSENGFEIESPQGSFRFIPDSVLRSVEEYEGCPDYIMVAAKVLPEMDLPAIIKSAVGPRTAIFLLQNGVDIETRPARVFKDNEIISGLAFVCLSRTAPGRIIHQGYGRLTIGLYPSGLSEKVKMLAELFHAGGVDCRVEENILSARWRKLVWNAPFNPISVLAGGADTKKIVDSDNLLRLVVATMEEVRMLAKIRGCELPVSVIDENIEATRRMDPYKTSMLLDCLAGRPMEVEAILGNAVRIGRSAGLKIPRMETLYCLLKALDDRVREGVDPKC